MFYDIKSMSSDAACPETAIKVDQHVFSPASDTRF
jgi:hypothetical protein